MLTKEDLEREIQKVLKQIVEKYQPEKVILFGSAADPAAFEVNDLDFLIIKEEVPERGIDRIYELECMIERHAPVDLLVYRPSEIEERLRLGDPFIKLMMSRGRLLYG